MKTLETNVLVRYLVKDEPSQAKNGNEATATYDKKAAKTPFFELIK